MLHREAAFVEEILEGDVRLGEIREMLEALTADPAWDPRFDGLVDLSGGRLQLTKEEVGTIADQLSNDPAASRGRWAFVVKDPINHGLVRMFASLVEDPPAEVRIFADRRSAIEWLVGGR